MQQGAFGKLVNLFREEGEILALHRNYSIPHHEKKNNLSAAH